MHSELSQPSETHPTPSACRSIPVERAAIALVLLATFVAYAGALGFGFVSDDYTQIVTNPFLRSWRFLPRYFLHDVWHGLAFTEISNYYRPVFMVWLRINDALFGLHPAGWHLTAIMLHVLVTWMVYRLTIRILSDRPAAGLAALIFGLHPVHLESVAWVSGATDPLTALWLVSSLLCYLRFREKSEGRWIWLTAALGLYTLAMLSKETALALPILIFGYEWIFPTPDRKRVIARAGAALLASLPFGVLTLFYLAQRAEALGGLSRAYTLMPWWAMALTWPSVLLFYLKHLVWPVGLSLYYDTPYVIHAGFWNFALPLVILSGVAWGLYRWAKFSPRAAFAILWLTVPLLPVLDLSVFPWGEIAHDRYLYFPSIGFALLAAMALRRVRIGRRSIFGEPAAQVAIALAYVFLLGLATVNQSVYWADGLVLADRAVKIAPENPHSNNDLGVALLNTGDTAKAIVYFQRAIQIHSNFWDPHYHLGDIYFHQGDLARADHYLSRAIQTNPLNPQEFLMLGLVRFEQNQPQDAVRLLRQAVALDPEGVGNHFALGVVREKQGDISGALREFELEPHDSPKFDAAREAIERLRSDRKKH